MIQVNLRFHEDEINKIELVESLEIGLSLKELLRDFYGESSACEYARNLEEFSTKADTSKLEFHHIFDKWTFLSYFVVYLDKDRSRLSDRDVYAKYGIDPSPETYPREGIVFTSNGEIRIGTLVNNLLHGGRGRKYFFKDFEGKHISRLNILDHPDFKCNQPNYDLIRSLITEEIFN